MNAYERHTNQYMIDNDRSLAEMYRRIGLNSVVHHKYVKNSVPMVNKGYKIAKFLKVPIQELWSLDDDK